MATRRTDEKFVVGADTKQAERGLARIVRSFRVQAAAIAAIATGIAAKIGGGLISLYRTQEQAERQLLRALKASNQYTSSYHQRLINLSKEVQQLTITGDETALAVIQNLVTVGRVGVDSIRDATFATIGLANQQGRSIERMQRTIVTSLNQIANENVNSLGEAEKFLSSQQVTLIRELKKTEGGIVAQRKAIELLYARYGEFADSVKGTTDDFESLSNAWGDLKEEGGRIVTGVLAPMARWLGKVIVKVTELIAKFGPHDDSITGQMKKLEDQIKKASTAVNTLIDLRDRALAIGADTSEFDKRIEAETQAVSALHDEWKRLDEIKRAQPSLLTPIEDEEATGEEEEKEEDNRAEIERDRKFRLSALKDERDDLRNHLAGMSESRREYFAERANIQREMTEVMATLTGEENAAEREQLMENLLLKQEILDQARDREREAEQQAMMEKAEREREAWAFARELELEQRMQWDEEDWEYLNNKYLTQEELDRQHRQKMIDQAIAEQRRKEALEKKHGKTMAKIVNTFESQQYKAAVGMANSLLALMHAGGAKSQKERERQQRQALLLQLATAPYEAYANTSKAYGFPLGPKLGLLHAALVAGQILRGLSAVGGGGGGEPVGGGGDTTVPTVETGAGAGPNVEPDREEARQQPIVVQVNVDLEGQTIAQIVQDTINHADQD